MEEKRRIHTPFTQAQARALRAGEQALLSGTVYTARDAAHKRLCEMLGRGEALPFPLRDAIVYYAGPCPAGPGAVIGPCGPTTSGRMDAYTPALLRAGLRGMIGKGYRSEAVTSCMRECGAVYFAATGGAGALLAKHVKKAALVAFEELGAEAVYRLEVEDFPLAVATDTQGNDIYRLGRERYRRR